MLARPARSTLFPYTTLFRSGEVLDVRVWTEDLAVHDAEVLATYADGPVPGGAAITRAARGSGHAWYLASDLSIDGLSGVFAEVYTRAGITDSDLPADVELVERTAEDGTRHLFAINHTAEEHTLTLEGRTLHVAAGAVATTTVPAQAAVTTS